MLVTGKVDFENDTLLIMSKSQSINVANQIISHIDLRNRHILSLQRHEALLDLYVQLNKKHEIKESIMKNQSDQIDNLTDSNKILIEDNERLKEVAKKAKNESLFTGIGIGIVVGVLGTAIILGATN